MIQAAGCLAAEFAKIFVQVNWTPPPPHPSTACPQRIIPNIAQALLLLCMQGTSRLAVIRVAYTVLQTLRISIKQALA